MKKLITYEWNFKNFTSQDRLNDLFINGLINRDIILETEYGKWYKYSTKDGREIAKFYKDNGFGFCTQATGIELTSVTNI